MKYVVDLDNTLLFTIINENGEYEVFQSNNNLIKKINNLYDSGNTIIIWTGRHWNYLEITKKQLDDNNIKYTTLLMAKPYADVYIDDKAVKPEEFDV